MSSPSIFLDTSFFKAFIDEKDDFHEQALQTWQALHRQNASLITSNFILDETFTLLRSRCGLSKVNTFRQLIARSAEILIVIRVTIEDEAEAWNWFTKDWSGLSFTDCVSFALMKRLEITYVATFDQDFTRAGFKQLEEKG